VLLKEETLKKEFLVRQTVDTFPLNVTEVNKKSEMKLDTTAVEHQ
jgi:hypothetical protein